MNRRNFLALVGALPFVGPMIARSAENERLEPAKAPCANRGHYLIDGKWYCNSCAHSAPPVAEWLLSMLGVSVWGQVNPVCGTIDTKDAGKRNHKFSEEHVMLVDPNDTEIRELMSVSEIEARIGKPFSGIIRNA